MLESVDVVVWFKERDEVEAHPVYRALNVAREERHIFMGGTLEQDAVGFNSVLSIPFFIEGLALHLSATLKGDGAER